MSGAWQMLLGGGVCALTGVATGELAGLKVDEFSLRSAAGLAYFVVFGSWLAFTAYAGAAVIVASVAAVVRIETRR